MNGILISQPITALDGIVHVPAPVVFRHVAERRVDAALGGDRVRAGGKELGDAGRFESRFRQTHGGAEAAAAASHHNGVVRVVHDGVVANHAAGREASSGDCGGGCCRRGCGSNAAAPRSDSRHGGREHRGVLWLELIILCVEERCILSIASNRMSRRLEERMLAASCD